MSNIDWTILEGEGVMDAVERAAREVARSYPTFEAEDLAQDACLLVALRPDEYRVDLGVLHFRLVRDLIDQVKTEAKYRSKSVSRERLIEADAA
jgi:DNA-directed RNA polymerase specialized sigma24 family protein